MGVGSQGLQVAAFSGDDLERWNRWSGVRRFLFMKKSKEWAVLQKAPLKESGDPLDSAFPRSKKAKVEDAEKSLSQFAGRRGVRSPRR